MRKRKRVFLREESGAAIMEYAILVSLIALVVAGAVVGVGTSLETKYQTLADCFKSPRGALCPI
ncbi:MAG: Flp family type IVb pilin [Hyphomicrobiaceae bacterium]